MDNFCATFGPACVRVLSLQTTTILSQPLRPRVRARIGVETPAPALLAIALNAAPEPAQGY
jgi:hypothetical protein